MHSKTITPGDPNIYYSGRFDRTNSEKASHSWPGSSIFITFRGTSLYVFLKTYCGKTDRPLGNYYDVILDGQTIRTICSNSHTHKHLLVNTLDDTTHTIELFRRTESFTGYTDFEGFEIHSPEDTLNVLPYKSQPLKIEWYGDSITCGYGNEGTGSAYSAKLSNHNLAFPSICSRILNADHRSIAFSGEGIFRRHDGDTTTSLPMMHDRTLYHRKEHWDFSTWIPTIVIINLGTNDYIAGVPKKELFISHYTTFVKKLRSRYPAAEIIALFGPDYNKYDNTNQKQYIKTVVDSLRKNDKLLHFFEFTTLHNELNGIHEHPNLVQHALAGEELAHFIKNEILND